MKFKDYLEEYAGVKIKIVDHKESKLFQTLRWATKIITFGQVELEDFTVVLGDTIYARGGSVTYETMAHEVKHLLQKKEDKLFMLKYLFFPLPWGKTYRSEYEREGYEISCFIKLLSNKHQDKKSLESIRNTFVSDVINNNFYNWPYFFMCWDLEGLKNKMYKTTDKYIAAIKSGETKALNKYEGVLLDYYFLFKQGV